MLCAVCGKNAPLRCSKCKSVSYCSRVCQEADWKQAHKRACKLLLFKLECANEEDKKQEREQRLLLKRECSANRERSQ